MNFRSDLLALDHALNALSKAVERKSQLRCFGVRSVEETGEVLGCLSRDRVPRHLLRCVVQYRNLARVSSKSALRHDGIHIVVIHVQQVPVFRFQCG